MTAQVLKFPRKPTSAELCRELAFSVPCSDNEGLAQLLQEKGWGQGPEGEESALRMIAIAKSVFTDLLEKRAEDAAQ